MTGHATGPDGTISVMSAIALKVAFDRWIVPAFEASHRTRLDIVWEPTTVSPIRSSQAPRYRRC